MGEVYLTEKELCEWLKFSRMKIFRLRKEGLPYIKVGKSVRYDKGVIEKWLNEKAQN